MSKNNRYKSGGMKKLLLRQRQRKTGAGIRVYFGKQNIGVGTVRSLNTLFKNMPKAKLRKEIYELWKKFRKKVDALRKEGYTFDGEIEDVYNGNLKNSKKFKEWLEKMDKRQLRRSAASFLGEADKEVMAELLRQKRAAEREARKRLKEEQAEEERRRQEEAEEELPGEIWVKIENIIKEETAYIAEIQDYRPRSNELVEWAQNFANDIIENLKSDNVSMDTLEEVVSFWEGEGGLYGVVESAETRFRGLFYADYGAGFNQDLLFMFMGSFEGFEVERVRSNEKQRYYPTSAEYDFYDEQYEE